MSQEEATIPPAVSPTPDEINAAALEVNAASDELATAITAIERYLEARNMGVSAWVKVKGWSNPDGEYWRRELGYEWNAGAWRIGIRETSGHQAWPEEDRVHTWQFNSSPRKARISASEKLPELLREIVKEASRTARRLREKAVEANAFASTLKSPAKPAKK